MYEALRSQASSHDSGWPTLPEEAIWEDSAPARTALPDDLIKYDGFDFSNLPSTITITGIGIRLDGYKDEIGGSGDLRFGIELSWNAGSSWTPQKTTPLLGFNNAIYALGGHDDTWGHSWSRSELQGSQFVVRVDAAYDSVVSSPGWNLVYITATVFYQETSSDSHKRIESIGITESITSSLICVAINEKIQITDGGSQSPNIRIERGTQNIQKSGTAVTSLESDSDFSASAERPRRSEGIGALIQLGITGPHLYIGDATITTQTGLSYPGSYMQAGLLALGELNQEADFLNGSSIPTASIRVANKDYVDQSGGSTTPKNISEHTLGLPTVGRTMIVWMFAESGDGWKKRIVFNGDIEEIEFSESEIVFHGVQLGTTQKAIPDIVIDENLFAYEPGSTAVDTGEEVEGNRGRPVPIGFGRFDYGAVKKPADFAAGHPFRFNAQSGSPTEDQKVYSQIALFPAMFGLKHPMMPIIHAASRYRRTEADTGANEFHSLPWQNVFLYGSRKGSPNLGVLVGSSPSQYDAQQYPNVDTRTVTANGAHNADRYLMIFTWDSQTNRGVPLVKPTSDTIYSNSRLLNSEPFVSFHASGGTMEQLGFPLRSNDWSDGSAQDAFGIFVNMITPDSSVEEHLPEFWPDVWQCIALPMARHTAKLFHTRVSGLEQQFDVPFDIKPFLVPRFETKDTTDPENLLDINDPETFTTIASNGSVSLQAPIEGPNLGTMRMVRFNMIWNTSTSSATTVKLYARFSPFFNYGIIKVGVSDPGNDYNASKNVTLNTADVDENGRIVPNMKLSGVSDRSFASMILAPFFDSKNNDQYPIVDTTFRQMIVQSPIQKKFNVWPYRRYSGQWQFTARDAASSRGYLAFLSDNQVLWPTDVMIKPTDGTLDVIACWLEVVFQSRLGGSLQKTLLSPEKRTRETLELVSILDRNRGPGLGWRRRTVTEPIPFFDFSSVSSKVSTSSDLYVTGKGAVDTSPPTFTDTANKIIEHPADGVSALISHYLGDSVLKRRATGSTFGSFTTARTLLPNYRMAPVIAPRNQIAINKAFDDIGFQSRSFIRERLDGNGNLQWVVVVDDPDPATNDAQRVYSGFTNNLVRWNNIAAGSFRISLTPYEDLASSVVLRYGWHIPTSSWSGEMYCTPESTNFTTLRTAYRDAMEFAKIEYHTDVQVTIDAPDVWDPAVAEDLAKWHCNLVRRRRVIVEFETYANAFDLEPGHVIKFDDEIADRVAFPGEGSGSWSTHQFNVVQTNSSKEAGQLARVFVRAVEVYSKP